MHERHSFPAELEAVSRFTQHLETRLEALPVAVRTAVSLAVHELLVNIVEHAYAGAPGSIEVEMMMSDAELRLSIHDHAANGFTMPDVVASPDPFDLPESGMGLFIIHQAFDHVQYERVVSGNWWQLAKRLGETL